MDGTNRNSRAVPGRVLVTGGAGFIGAHLCQRLLAEGNEVVVLDNYATGSRQNLRHLLPDARLQLLEGDVTAGCRAGPFSRIYNLACCASPAHYQARPLDTLRTCLDGALAMLDLAHQCDARIFQASTSEVYGEPEVHPQAEDYRGAVSSTGPRACYDEGKRSAEAAFFDHQRVHGTDIKVARIFNTYGPRMRADDGRVVTNLIVQALANEPMTVYGDGSQTRSFCYVDDLVEGIERLMRTPRGWGGPVNLGNPHEITVLELAQRILALTGSRSRIVLHPLPTDDPTRRCPDISLARRMLDWEPRTSLDDGLAATIAWFDSHFDDARSGILEAQRDCA